MQTPAAERTPDQQAAVFAAWRLTVPDLKPLNDEIDAQWKNYPQAPTSVLHLAERRAGNVRQTHLLDRGNWDQPRQVVEPHTPAALHPLRECRPARPPGVCPLAGRPAIAADGARGREPRLAGDLRRRSGRDAEDFGTRAPVPEYRELLDWLAVDFMEHGWSQKHLIRTIVTSATYQQSSAASHRRCWNAIRAIGWLARGPRFRADAEVVRDIALSASGLITHKLGGPSIIPPVPQNVLDYNYTYPAYWTPAQGPERYRRTLYVFRKRSMPDPVLSSFDAPTATCRASRRARSNTPLAALTGLNETIFVEAAQALALRILREGGTDDAQRADYAFRLCTARLPRAGGTRRDPVAAAIAAAAAGRRLAEHPRNRHRRSRETPRASRRTRHRRTPPPGRWSPACC